MLFPPRPRLSSVRPRFDSDSIPNFLRTTCFSTCSTLPQYGQRCSRIQDSVDFRLPQFISSYQMTRQATTCAHISDQPAVMPQGPPQIRIVEILLLRLRLRRNLNSSLNPTPNYIVSRDRRLRSNNLWRRTGLLDLKRSTRTASHLLAEQIPHTTPIRSAPDPIDPVAQAREM